MSRPELSSLVPQARPASRRARLVQLGVRLLGPAILVLVIARMEDAGAVLRTLASADALPLALAVLLNVPANHLKVLRWDALLGARGYHYPPKRAWTSFLSSVYVGMLTPGRIGDVLRVQYLRHDLGMPYPEGLAVIVIDRLCDLYVLLGFVAIGIARFSRALVGEIAVVTWAGVVLTGLGPLALLVPGLAEAVMRRVYRKLAREEGGFARFLEALRGQLGRGLARALVLSVAAFGVNYAQGWLMARSLHLGLGLLDVIGLLAIGSLLGLLPVSVSGVGVRELFFALVFPVLGHSPEAGVGYGIMVFAVIYLCTVAMGFVSWQIAPPPLGIAASAPPEGSAPSPGAAPTPGVPPLGASPAAPPRPSSAEPAER